MRPVLPEIFKFNTTMEIAVRGVAAQPKHIALFLGDFFAVMKERGSAVPAARIAAHKVSARTR
jgi:hypothetical protein